MADPDNHSQAVLLTAEKIRKQLRGLSPENGLQALQLAEIQMRRMYGALPGQQPEPAAAASAEAAFNVPSVAGFVASPRRLSGTDPFTDGKQASMLNAAKPLIEWLNDNAHPHCTAHVDQTTVVLTEGVATARTGEFLRD